MVAVLPEFPRLSLEPHLHACVELPMLDTSSSPSSHREMAIDQANRMLLAQDAQ